MTTNEVIFDGNTPLDFLVQEAENGNPEAQDFLGKRYYGERYYRNRSKEASRNYTVVVKWLHKAAEQGGALAQHNLARHYFLGNGVPEDRVKAVEWFRKAAEQGHADAQCMLGTRYCSGDGVTIDTTESVRWWRKAAEQGHGVAQLNLGMHYDYGEDVPKDYVEAVKWYQKAAEQGDARTAKIAQERLQEMKWKKSSIEQRKFLFESQQ